MHAHMRAHALTQETQHPNTATAVTMNDCIVGWTVLYILLHVQVVALRQLQWSKARDES